jgi:hypothetical protein
LNFLVVVQCLGKSALFGTKAPEVTPRGRRRLILQTRLIQVRNLPVTGFGWGSLAECIAESDENCRTARVLMAEFQKSKGRAQRNDCVVLQADTGVAFSELVQHGGHEIGFGVGISQMDGLLPKGNRAPVVAELLQDASGEIANSG